jgi:acetyl-CoA carboxylase biotin carboxyl carrier protein
MELEKIKELIEMMKANDLNELEIVDGQTRVMLKRGAGEQTMPQVVAMPSVVSAPVAGLGMVPAEQVTEVDRPSEKQETNAVEIVSPIVGTFYLTPSPNADPFVKVGASVEEDTVVCIIEAMKVMNEIKSEIKGTIKKILASNGQSVEYGEPLFQVEPE